jgi:hypothetical protein
MNNEWLTTCSSRLHTDTCVLYPENITAHEFTHACNCNGFYSNEMGRELGMHDEKEESYFNRKTWRQTPDFLKNTVLWDLAQCKSCVNWRFGGIYGFHLQGRKIRERGTSVSSLLQTDFLFSRIQIFSWRLGLKIICNLCSYSQNRSKRQLQFVFCMLYIDILLFRENSEFDKKDPPILQQLQFRKE